MGCPPRGEGEPESVLESYGCLDFTQDWLRGSLSLRERAGVRGNSASKAPGPTDISGSKNHVSYIVFNETEQTTDQAERTARQPRVRRGPASISALARLVP